MVSFVIYHIQGTDAFSQSGLYSNHQDIAPRYSVSNCNSVFFSNYSNKPQNTLKRNRQKLSFSVMEQLFSISFKCGHSLSLTFELSSGDLIRPFKHCWCAGGRPGNSSHWLYIATRFVLIHFSLRFCHNIRKAYQLRFLRCKMWSNSMKLQHIVVNFGN